MCVRHTEAENHHFHRLLPPCLSRGVRWRIATSSPVVIAWQARFDKRAQIVVGDEELVMHIYHYATVLSEGDGIRVRVCGMRDLY